MLVRFPLNVKMQQVNLAGMEKIVIQYEDHIQTILAN
jgi:hypothetical protein